MKRVWVFGIGSLLVGAIVGLGLKLQHHDATTTTGTTPAEGQSVNWLIVGGGGTPEQNQISIEDDVLLAQQTFPGEGMTLFAGGPGSSGVQVSEARKHSTIRKRLADLFSPANRDTKYVKTRVISAGPSTREEVLSTLASNLDGTEPLLVYFAGHGDMGARPAENLISTWGNDTITVADLATTLDAHQSRPVKLAMTSCFSGGFADVIFAAGDADQGPAAQMRCGVFASTWDLEAGGCDPDPVRGNHEGFGIHFLHALKGTDRNKTPIQVDLDGNGISLLEAFTTARIASKSIDVPTTTSERLLRQFAAADGVPTANVSLPEEERVISELLAREKLGSADEAAEKFAEIQLKMSDVQQRAAEASEAETLAFRAIAAVLVAKWPAVGDPWHPDFEPTVAEHGDEILQFLDSHPLYASYQMATADVGKITDELSELQVQSAPLERIARALENLQLAAVLKTQSPEKFQIFERVRACENEPLQ